MVCAASLTLTGCYFCFILIFYFYRNINIAVTMATSNAFVFVTNPTLSLFYKCHISDLCGIATHYSIAVLAGLPKADLKADVFDGLVKHSVLPLDESAVGP